MATGERQLEDLVSIGPAMLQDFELLIHVDLEKGPAHTGAGQHTRRHLGGAVAKQVYAAARPS